MFLHTTHTLPDLIKIVSAMTKEEKLHANLYSRYGNENKEIFKHIAESIKNKSPASEPSASLQPVSSEVVKNKSNSKAKIN